MMILVITEYDYQFKDDCQIGVADSLDNAMKVIQKYYGEHEITNKYPHDEEPNRETSLVIEIPDGIETYKYLVGFEWFKLNDI